MRAACSLLPSCLLLSCLALSACATPEPSRQLTADFAIVRLAVDPATELGEIFTIPNDPIAGIINDSFDSLACDGDLPMAFRLRADLTDRGGEGDVALLFILPVGTSDLCVAGGSGFLQTVSETPGWTPGMPESERFRVHGPAYFQGRTLDSRIELGAVPLDLLSAFPRWWRLGGGLEGFEIDPAPDAPPRALRFRDVELSTTWLIAQLYAETPADPMGVLPAGSTLLDGLITAGYQPDHDVDGDGLERFEDTAPRDQFVDVCVDGDGTRYEGRDCPLRPEFADGYDLQLRFRVVPITVRED